MIDMIWNRKVLGYLTERQYREIKRICNKYKWPMSEAVRRGLDLLMLQEREKEKRNEIQTS